MYLANFEPRYPPFFPPRAPSPVPQHKWEAICIGVQYKYNPCKRLLKRVNMPLPLPSPSQGKKRSHSFASLHSSRPKINVDPVEASLVSLKPKQLEDVLEQSIIGPKRQKEHTVAGKIF